MQKRKYEVLGTDQNGDIWIVGTDLQDTAEAIAEDFRKKGYKDVHIRQP